MHLGEKNRDLENMQYEKMRTQKQRNDNKSNCSESVFYQASIAHKKKYEVNPDRTLFYVVARKCHSKRRYSTNKISQGRISNGIFIPGYVIENGFEERDRERDKRDIFGFA